MKSFKILSALLAVMFLASCQGPAVPESTDGHQLWFYSLDQDGMNLSPEKTTPSLAKMSL